jgi:hypothetical protein
MVHMLHFHGKLTKIIRPSPEGSANHMCEILSEIKDIKYSKVP